MDKLKESASFLFKEKNWIIKFIVPFIFTFLFLGISAVINNQISNLNMYDYNYGYDYMRGGSNPTAFVPFILSCLICFLLIPFIFIALWYGYEVTQSGIQNRMSESLFGGNFSDKLKKIGKYGLVSLIYGIIFGIVGFGIYMIFSVVTAIILASSWSLQPSRGFEPYMLVLICVFCVFALIILGLYILASFVVLPSYLKMISTNTFGDAFKFKENWNTAKKHYREFLGIILVSLVGSILIGILSLPFSFLTDIFVGVPLLQFVLGFLSIYLVSIVSTYFSYFFLPRFIGLVYRDIMQKKD